MANTENMTCGCYWSLLWTNVRRIAEAVCLVELFSLKFLLSKSSDRFLITGEDHPPQTKDNDFEHRKWSNPGYIVIVNVIEQGMFRVAPGRHKCVFYSEEWKAKLYQVVKMEEVRQVKECVLSGHRSERSAGGGWKAN